MGRKSLDFYRASVLHQEIVTDEDGDRMIGRVLDVAVAKSMGTSIKNAHHDHFLPRFISVAPFLLFVILLHFPLPPPLRLQPPSSYIVSLGLEFRIN